MKKSVIASFALLLLALSACQKESDPSYKQEMEKDDAISFMVKEAEPFVTKSSDDMPVQTYSQVIFSKDSLDIFLNMNESNYKADFFSESLIETKGAPYQNNEIGEFFVSAFFSDMQQFFSNAKLNSTDGSTVSTGYYWPLTTPATSLNFFGYAKKSADGQITRQSQARIQHQRLNSRTCCLPFLRTGSRLMALLRWISIMPCQPFNSLWVLFQVISRSRA